MKARSLSATLFLCMFAGQASLIVLTPMLPEVASHFGVTIATAGQLRSASGLAAGAAALLTTAAAGRIGIRQLLGLGLALLGAGSLGSAVAPTFALLLVAQLPIGAGLALVLGASLAAAGTWAAPADRSRVLSWTLLGPPTAWVVGMPAVGALTSVNWRIAWLAVPFAGSVAAVAAVGAVFGWRREDGEPAPRQRGRRAWARPAVASWAIGELFAYSAWAGILVYGGALFIESYGVSTETVGLLLAGIALAYMPGNFLARRWVATHARLMLIFLAVTSAGLVALLAVSRTGAAASFVTFAALGFISGARTIAGSAFGLDAAPEEKVVVGSLRTAALQYGYFVGAAIGGVALAAGGFTGLGVAFAGLYLLAAVPHVAALILAGPSPQPTVGR